MNKSPHLLFRPFYIVRLVCFGAVLSVAGGCTLFHNFGSGTHLDAPPEKTAHKGTAKASTMQIEVVTNGAAEVVSIHFVRSSGSDAVDNFVADSIRREWPGTPSTRSLVEVRYAPGSGFTEPKLISSAPAT